MRISGLTIGNTTGGRLADRGGSRALLAAFLVLIVVMAAFTHAMHDRIACAVTVFVWGIAAFATVPGLQMRVLHQAAGAPNLAATLNIGAFNIGNALGAWLGGAALSRGAPLDSLPWVAALMTLAGVGVTLVAMRLDRQASGAGAGAVDAGAASR